MLCTMCPTLLASKPAVSVCCILTTVVEDLANPVVGGAQESCFRRESQICEPLARFLRAVSFLCTLCKVIELYYVTTM